MIDARELEPNARPCVAKRRPLSSSPASKTDPAGELEPAVRAAASTTVTASPTDRADSGDAGIVHHLDVPGHRPGGVAGRGDRAQVGRVAQARARAGRPR